MFKKIWFQIHWFLGITAGTVMIVIGLSGALLSFREEIVDLLNPGILHVPPSAGRALPPDQLLAKASAQDPGRRIVALAMSAAAGESAKLTYAPPKGIRRGEIRYADPYTGALLARPTGQDFFEWTERLHRWLLLPTDSGKLVAGTVSVCLFVLALSGLYLRWPRKPLSLRAWLKLDFALSGRSFLWNLHSVLGTCALLLYLVFTITGMYWAFDWVKQGMNAIAGETAPRKAPPAQGDKNRVGKMELPAAPPDLALAWEVFQKEAGAYSRLSMRMPDKAGQPLQIIYLDPDPPHEQARNRISIDLLSGKVSQNQRYADKSMGGKAISTVYPLHMGTYFGLPGRIAMMLAALMLPLFSITGWMLYLDRRRKKRQIRGERAMLRAGRKAARTTGAASSSPNPLTEQVLLAFATQSGRAEGLAWRTAAALQDDGVETTVMSLAQLDTDRLCHYRRVLFIVSTFGEGEPPDAARKFARQLSHQPGSTLSHVQYGLLALGDRNYQKFCGFGHTLDHWLRNQGAQALFPMIEVDNSDAQALAQWQQALGSLAGKSELQLAVAPELDGAPCQAWQLAERRLLNPRSQGEPIFHLELAACGDQAVDWRPGAVAEIVPRHAPDRIAFFLGRAGLDGLARVQYLGAPGTLGEALARSQLPAPHVALGHVTAQQLADSLRPLASRRYSVASIASEGRVKLLVRQSSHEDGLGIGSGWLTEYAAMGRVIEMRLLANPGFELVAGGQPCIFIGNGSGLAGLRGLLKARIAHGQHRNWLLFGERQEAHDFHYRDEVEQWQADAYLSRVDLAFSRDQPQRIYVQDRLREAAGQLREWVEQGAVIYICGSLEGMASGVDTALAEILGTTALDELIAEGRYRRDVY
ncbi:MAG: sulfite reductase flavoprotein subunit alpha [Pseudomonadota bacterium]